uniref:Uncharacterized protein n=1 Tax=Arabidopsis thaliana TaxID=3702 RepID=Q56ZX7_ARATH|nr:hypothetical protein [Arabidopsis thaliana]
MFEAQLLHLSKIATKHMRFIYIL